MNPSPAPNAKDPFGFDQLNEPGQLDLAAFTPKPKRTDRAAADAAAQVARDSGFTRRTAPSANVLAPESPPSPKAEKGRKRRVNISELLGIQDRYPQTERAQLNMLVPVPVFLRWRALVQNQQIPAWEVLEAALNILETKSPPTKQTATKNG